MHSIIAVSIFAASVFFNTTVTPSVLEEYCYREKTGARLTKITWRLEQKEYHQLTVTRPGETYVCRCNSSYETFQWEARKPTAGTEVVATRDGDDIIVKGTFEGESVNKQIRIDDAPWYQAMTLSLRPLVASNKSSVEFWTIRSDNLSAYKMKAKKSNLDRTMLCGSESEVEKVNVRLAGLKALLWECCYWFRKEDGLFVKYEGRNGPPGHPQTVIELAEVEQQQ